MPHESKLLTLFDDYLNMLGSDCQSVFILVRSLR